MMKRLAIILVLLCAPAWASIAYVSASHTVCTQTSSSTATQTCTLGAATTAGNTVVVGVSWKTTTRTFTKVVGSASTSHFYQYTPTTCNSTNVCVVQAICVNCPALTTVAPTLSGGSVFVTTAEEYSGVGSIGIYATATGSSANPSVSLTTSDANNWVVAATANLANAGIPTHGTGSVGTLRDANRTGTTSSHVAGAANDNTAASPGSVANTVTITSGVWAAVATELRSVAASQQYIWPNCDSTHPCVIHHYVSIEYPSDPGTLQDIKLNIEPSKAGNLLVLAVSHISSKTLSTPTDDQSNTWVAGPTTTNSSDAFTSEIWYKCGAATGTSQITLHLSAALGSADALQISFMEVSGIATSSCVDGTSTAANGLNSGIFQPGSITTTQVNSLVYNYVVTSYPYPESNPPLPWLVPDGATALLSANLVDGFVSAVQVVASAGAVNPSLYVVDPVAGRWNDLAIAFKASSGAGTQPSGINLTRQLYFTPTDRPNVNTPFPTSGNAMLVLTAYPAGSNPLTSVADGVHTYTNVNGTVDGQAYYSCSTTASAQRRITYTTSDYVLIGFYDIAGAASGGGTPSTACYDTSHDVTGSQTNAGDTITVTNAVAPTTSNGLVITTIVYGNGPPSGVTAPSGAVFDSLWATGMTDSDNFNSGDGYIHYYNPNTSAVSYTVTNANAEASAWESFSLAFKAPAATGVRKRVIVTSE